MTAFHETPAAGPSAARAFAMQALVPEYRTDRLRLRAPRIEDFQFFADIVLGPQGRNYGNPETREDAWGEFVQMTSTWFLRGHGAWAVETRDGALIGFVHYGAEPGDQEPELGYILMEEAQGQGYAHEATAVLRDAAPSFGFGSLVSYVSADNPRSITLATRLGASRDAAAEAALPEPDRSDTYVFRHLLPKAEPKA